MGKKYPHLCGIIIQKIIEIMNNQRLSTTFFLLGLLLSNTLYSQHQNQEIMQSNLSKERVQFTVEGLVLTGNVFKPANFDPAQTYPAIIIDGSWTTVKEQMQELYAERLAEHGFVTLAFDHRYYGESEGLPREFENHVDKVADIKAAVTYLQSLPFVQADQIGGVGVCASGAYMMQAVAEDSRLKALGTVVAWLMTAETAKLFYGGDEGTALRIGKAQQAKEAFEKDGTIAYVPAYDPNDMEAAMFFPVDYYAKENRGAIPTWTNNFAVMSWEPWLTYDGIAASKDIVVPTLMIGSEKQFLVDGAKTAFDQIPHDEKQALWLNEVEHDQFYDDPAVIESAVEALSKHFKASLTAGVTVE